MKYCLTFLFTMGAFAQTIAPASAVEMGKASQQIRGRLFRPVTTPNRNQSLRWEAPGGTTRFFVPAFAPTTALQGYDGQAILHYETRLARQRLADLFSDQLHNLTGFKFVRQDGLETFLPIPPGQRGWWGCKELKGVDFCGGMAHPSHWGRPVYLDHKGLRGKVSEYYVGPHVQYTWPKSKE